MRKRVRIKNWMKQGTNRTKYAQQGKVLFIRRFPWQEQDCKHSNSAMVERQTLRQGSLSDHVPTIQKNQLDNLKSLENSLKAFLFVKSTCAIDHNT